MSTPDRKRRFASYDSGRDRRNSSSRYTRRSSKKEHDHHEREERWSGRARSPTLSRHGGGLHSHSLREADGDSETISDDDIRAENYHEL